MLSSNSLLHCSGNTSAPEIIPLIWQVEHACPGLALWWSNPVWLVLPPSQWPSKRPSKPAIPALTASTKPCLLLPPQTVQFLVKLWARYSSFFLLVRVVGWIRRFAFNSRLHADQRRFDSQPIASFHCSSMKIPLRPHLTSPTILHPENTPKLQHSVRVSSRPIYQLSVSSIPVPGSMSGTPSQTALHELRTFPSDSFPLRSL